MGGMSRRSRRLILFRCLRDGSKNPLDSWTWRPSSKEWKVIKDKYESMLGWLELQSYGNAILSTKDEWKEKYPMKEQTPPDCTSCNGTGRVWYPGCDDIDSPCHDCNGIGVIIEPE